MAALDRTFRVRRRGRQSGRRLHRGLAARLLPVHHGAVLQHAGHYRVADLAVHRGQHGDVPAAVLWLLVKAAWPSHLDE